MATFRTNGRTKGFIKGRSMFNFAAHLIFCAAVLAFGSYSMAAQTAAHVHGRAQMNIAVEGSTITIVIEAPLDTLLGFEHAPRTAKEKQLASAAIATLQSENTIVLADAAAQCSTKKLEINDSALQKPDAKGSHADIDITLELSCKQPSQLKSFDVTLFKSFQRIQSINVQMLKGAKSSRQIMKRSSTLLRLPT